MLEKSVNTPSLTLENNFCEFIGRQSVLTDEERLFCNFFLACLRGDFCPIDLNVIISGRLLIIRRYQENQDIFYFKILNYLNELFEKTFVVLSDYDHLDSLNRATLNSVVEFDDALKQF